MNNIFATVLVLALLALATASPTFADEREDCLALDRTADVLACLDDLEDRPTNNWRI